jgi:O-antigen/teichoic acid export membrane protein
MATLVDQVLFCPLANGMSRFYAPACEADDLRGYLNAVRRLMLSATTGIILVGAIIAGVLAIATHTKWVGLATAALFFGLLSGHNSSLNGLQNAARQRSIVALHQGMEPWARFIAAASLMILVGSGSTTAMVGCAMGVMLVLGSQYYFFLKIVPPNASGTCNQRSWSEQIRKYSWPFAAWGIFTWAQVASDRWALGFFSSTREVGLYAALFHLGYSPLSRVTGMAMQLFAPIFYQRAGDASDNYRNADVNDLSWRLTFLALGVTCVAFLFAILFHKQIFRVIVAKEYATVSYLLPWMLLSSGAFAAGQTIALNLMSQMKTQTMTMVKIITALLGILFNVAGAYWYGTPGIVIAGVLFSLVYLFWMAVLSREAYEAAGCVPKERIGSGRGR